ncbi:MAG: S1-like domain-containing RNA-binding protein, partial [Proteobacteria bacterium]|nr:S1-like domain-containing RNA-binding protein [Pseudomonadota bacterium]
MAELGKFNNLEINKIVDYGVYLDGQQLGLILLPKKFVPENSHLGDPLEVFVYLDSNDELIATTDSPKVTLGLCAHLKIIQVNNVGAFADWGLPKDLLIPFAEQSFPLKEGQHITVCLYQDRASKRLVGSTKLSKHLNEFSTDFEVHQEVDLLICGRSDLGYKAVINNSHLGLIHISDIFKPPRMGQIMKAY